jgi:hypothetical protein
MLVKGVAFIIATGGDYLGVYVGIAILVLTVLSLIFTSISYKEFSDSDIVTNLEKKG